MSTQKKNQKSIAGGSASANDNAPALISDFLGAARDLDEVALVVIDVQDTFCAPGIGSGNSDTAIKAQKIATCATEFRQAGMDVYAVYFKFRGQDCMPYRFEPDYDRDTVIEKKHDSAFKDIVRVHDNGRLRPDRFKSLLERDGKTLLLTCGFNLSACVYDTAKDARAAGHDVVLLRDLAGNGRGGTEDMKERTLGALKNKGVLFMDSSVALSSIEGTHFSLSAP